MIRHPDMLDARATQACLTEKGRQALRRAAPVYLAGIDRYFNQHLSPSQRRSIARALDRVVRANAPRRRR